jgi:ubiquinone/menaquinone biosynthesis C-methylase UbiE
MLAAMSTGYAGGVHDSATVEREREFFNSQSRRFTVLRELIWRAIGEFNRNEEIHQFYDARGKRMLLYGCGPANCARRYLDAGVVTLAGIDISEWEIERAQQRAIDEGYADRVDFRAGDAHATGFADDSFDVIIGSAILHHLNLPLALAELRRILAPGGRAVFQEPLAHNPILRLGRRLTPSARTEDEHPITAADWRLCSEAFDGFWHREAELTSIPLMPLNIFLPRAWQRRLARRVSSLDDRLLERRPNLRRHARITFLVLE